MALHARRLYALLSGQIVPAKDHPAVGTTRGSWIKGFVLCATCAIMAVSALIPAQESRRVLTADDLRLLGGFRLPPEVTAFSMPGIAVRHVGSETRLFVTGHRLQSDPIFELRVPPTLAGDPLNGLRATTVTSWGTGRKTNVGNTGQLLETRGLQWHAGSLFFVYQEYYNVARSHNPSLGRIDAGGGTAEPWTSDAHSHLTGGYITEIPAWYASAYTGGRRLAVGSPLVSGNILSSWGPNLEAIDVPSGNATLSTRSLVRYDYSDRATRPDTYTALTQPPDESGGWWTQQDFLHGVAWVDTGSVHGVVFSGALTEGHVWYGPQNAGNGVADRCGEWTGPHAEDYDAYLWIYDPMSFAPVSGVDPASVRPASVFTVDTVIPDVHVGCLNRQGLTYDPVDERLYVLSMETDTTVAPYPIPTVYVFQVGTGGGPASTPAPGPESPPAPAPEPPSVPAPEPPSVPAPEPPSVPAPCQGNCAEFVSIDAPPILTTGQSTTAVIVLRNTGTTTWVPATSRNSYRGMRLGTQAPEDNEIWGEARWDLQASVAPGATVTIRAHLVAPSRAGTYTWRVRMLEEYVEWFGNLSPSRSIAVTRGRDNNRR